MPKVTLLTLTFNNPSILKKNIEAVRKFCTFSNWDWIILDNSSNLITYNYLTNLNDSRISVVRGDNSGNFSTMNNKLVSLTTSKYVCFINDDVEIKEDFLTKFIKLFEKNSDVGAIGYKLRYPNGGVQHAGIVFDKGGIPFNLGANSRIKYNPSIHQGIFEVKAVSAALLICKRKDFLDIGGFTESYNWGYEDVDLCLKLSKKLNKKIIVYMDSNIIHHESHTLGHNNPNVKANLKNLIKNWGPIKDNISLYKNSAMQRTYLKSSSKKILFYIEMHPIRESYVSHSWIVEELIRMVPKESNNFKILANHKILAKFKNYKNFINLSKKDVNIIDSFYCSSWNNQSIKDWINLMNGTSKKYLSFYSNILDKTRKEFPFDVLIYWGTNKTIKFYCDSKKIPSISMELGCTRKPNFKQTCYFDLEGVNGENSLNGVSYEMIESIPTSIPKFNALKKNYDPVPIKNSLIQNKLCLSWGRNVLIPLQLDDDSNILIHCDYDDVFSFVKETVEKFSSKGYTCFIKPHPGNVLRKYNKIKHNYIKNYFSGRKDVFWVENEDTLSLIYKCNIVVTLNSSLAFEASILNKIVINLGKSCWNIKGVYPSIDDILQERFDNTLYLKKLDKLISFLLEYYLIPYDKIFNFTYFKENIDRLHSYFNRRLGGENKPYILMAKPVNKLSDYSNLDMGELSKNHTVENTRIIYAQEDGNEVLGELFNNKLIQQHFLCNSNNLCRIDIKLATYMRTNKGVLRISLSELGGKLIQSKNIDMSKVEDNSWVSFYLKNIDKSKNKSYVLSLQGVNSLLGKSVTCYYNSRISYGKLLVNNTLFKGVLNMRIYAK